MTCQKERILKVILAILVLYGLISLYQAYITRGQVSYNFGAKMSSLKSFARAIWFKKYLIGSIIGLLYIIGSVLTLKYRKMFYFLMALAIIQLVIFLVLLAISYYSMGLLIVPILIFGTFFYCVKGE